jgi:hypothetical protein
LNNKCNPFFCFFINHIKTSRTGKVFPWFCQTVLFILLHFLCHSKKSSPCSWLCRIPLTQSKACKFDVNLQASPQLERRNLPIDFFSAHFF